MKGERVIFRKWDNGDICALFPDIPAGGGYCQSYEHIGQHGGADYGHVIRSTIPARPAEFAELARELRGLGYRLRVCKRGGNKVSFSPCNISKA